MVDINGHTEPLTLWAEGREPTHLTHNNFPKSTPAAAPDSGSKLSLASIRTQVSSCWLAAAIAASSTLVLPEEADPQISDRQPRGMPPVSASTSDTPVESISGRGRTSSRDAGRTSSNRPESAICLRILAFFSLRFRSGEAGNPAAIVSLKLCFGSAEAFRKRESPAFCGNADMRTSGRKSGLVLSGAEPE